MSFAESLLPEFDHEMAGTRAVLERIPDDKFDWRAHPKLNTIGWNANHIAEIPGWLTVTATTDTWDFAPVNGPRYQSPTFKSSKELVAFFDKGVAEARKALQALKDQDVGKLWSLQQGGTTLMTMPKGIAIRSFVMNHLIHHRAHLIAYLRMNDVKLPGMYGPTGD